MKKLNVKGTVVSNDQKWIYDWFDMESVSPNDIINSLPDDNQPVEVIINSGGGDVFAGSEIYTALKDYAGEVTTKIVGIGASIASVIAMAGDKVLMSPTSQLMIHNVSTGGSGDYRDFEHTAEVLRNANKTIANAYEMKTGKTHDELLAMMDKETWLSPQDAKEHGFIDEIMFENKAPSLVANYGNTLPHEIINKMMNMRDTFNPPSNKVDFLMQEKEKMEAQLQLLKLKGDISE